MLACGEQGLYEQLEADTVLYMQAERMPPDVQHQGLKYLEHEWRSQLRSQVRTERLNAVYLM